MDNNTTIIAALTLVLLVLVILHLRGTRHMGAGPRGAQGERGERGPAGHSQKGMACPRCGGLLAIEEHRLVIAEPRNDD